MNILECLLKIYPDWKGTVWNNCHEGIKPHELETRPVPTLKELEAVWPEVKAEMEQDRAVADAKALLNEIDLKSIRSIREWIALQPDAPLFVKEYENQAISARAKKQ